MICTQLSTAELFMLSCIGLWLAFGFAFVLMWLAIRATRPLAMRRVRKTYRGAD